MLAVVIVVLDVEAAWMNFWVVFLIKREVLN